MSVIGRGRGRGFAEARETALRRPGQASLSKFNDLINFIHNLNINDTSNWTDEFVHAVENATKENTLEEIFEDLHKQALENRQFGRNLIYAFSNIQWPFPFGSAKESVKRIILTIIQKDYEDREEIRKNSIIHFRNAVFLLGITFDSFKGYKGRPLCVMALPVIQGLESLLDNSEEEDIELVTTQIYINAQNVCKINPTLMEDFLIKVRLVLISRNLSARSRGMLLFILDFANQHFAPLSGQLQEFYENEISINTLIGIQQCNKNLTINTTLEKNVNDKNEIESITKSKNKPILHEADNSINNLMKTPKKGKSTGIGASEKSPTSAGYERPSLPRAIRGAGAVDNVREKNAKKSPRGRKDKITDDQIRCLKQNTNSKVWGHDDRFDKDYA